MPLSKLVRIGKDGIHGNCWFAADDIPVGEKIWWTRDPGAPHTDLFLTREQIAALPPSKRDKFVNLIYQVGDNLFCGFDPDKEPIGDELIEDYINHSCDGNTWYSTKDLLISRRPIKKGDEITYDYVMTECDDAFVLCERCLCGTERCRGRVTGKDWMREELQKEYEGHFYPHVQKKIEEAKKKGREKEKEEECKASE